MWRNCICSNRFCSELQLWECRIIICTGVFIKLFHRMMLSALKTTFLPLQLAYILLISYVVFIIAVTENNGRAMAWMVSPWLSTMEAQVQSQGITCRISNGEHINGTDFLTWLLFHQCPVFIHLFVCETNVVSTRECISIKHNVILPGI